MKFSSISIAKYLLQEFLQASTTGQHQQKGSITISQGFVEFSISIWNSSAGFSVGCFFFPIMFLILMIFFVPKLLILLAPPFLREE